MSPGAYRVVGKMTPVSTVLTTLKIWGQAPSNASKNSDSALRPPLWITVGPAEWVGHLEVRGYLLRWAD